MDTGGSEVPLSALQSPRVFRGLGPLGESLIVSGTAAGIAVEAAFHDGLGDAAAITVTLFPDRTQGEVRGIRYFSQPEAGILAGDGSLRALVNGYQSWSPCSVIEVTDHVVDTSHGATALARGVRAMGIVFDPGEPGQAAVHLNGGTVEARSDWLPARPLHPAGDSATMRLAYDPAGDLLSPLGALFVPGLADRARFATGAPAGWCSWYELGDAVTQDQVSANLEFCAVHLNSGALRYIQLDDGYQRAAGDWDANAKFPCGHRWLTDRIHASGFQAGLWIAPFAVTERSGIPAGHPDWLLAEHGRRLVPWHNESWGGSVYALDGAHPEVREWLRALARRAVQDWGYDYLKLDFLLLATSGGTHFGGATHAEAFRAGLEALREGAGPDVFLLGCGAPLQHAIGAVNGMRIGRDVDASWNGLWEPARATALRAFYQRGAWYNDPDCLVVRPPLGLEEARVWTSIVALSGGMTFLSDDLPRLPRDRLSLVQRAIPAAPVKAFAMDAAETYQPALPAIVLENGETVSLAGGWEQTRDEDGVAWYRKRFTLPVSPAERTGFILDGEAWLDLGSMPQGLQVLINGEAIDDNEQRPPDTPEPRTTCARYAIPSGMLHRGTENVVSVRTANAAGPDGRETVRCDRPPKYWVAAGAPEWRTVAFVNWEDEPRRMALSLDDLGMAAAHCACYEVWEDAPLSPITDVLVARVAPHATRVFALRPRADHPQVIGTTRHVVQGVVDLVMETWDPATRTLHGRSANLDGRPYAVTVAVPPGLQATSCEARPACTLRESIPGHVALAWPAGPVRDIEWALRFAPPAAPGAISGP